LKLDAVSAEVDKVVPKFAALGAAVDKMKISANDAARTTPLSNR
jgi:hypothetical protein